MSNNLILNGEQLLEQILEDKVIDLNNPSCNNCNECCSILTMISEEEYKFYKKYFKKNNFILKAAKERRNKLESNTGAVSWICPFTTKNKKCSIYNIRPKTCREFHCKPALNTFNKDELQFKKHYTIKDLL